MSYLQTPLDEAIRLALITYPAPWTVEHDAGYVSITAANGEPLIGLDIAGDGAPDRYYAMQLLVSAVNTTYGPPAEGGNKETTRGGPDTNGAAP